MKRFPGDRDVQEPTRAQLSGVLVVSLALLALEIALTRIFSVLLWYHFAFLAISLALFGLGAAGLLLHFFPERFPRERVGEQLARFAILFAFSIPLSFVLILGVPFVYRISFAAFVSLGLIYTFAALPFLLGGIVLGLALSRFPERVGTVYGFDLVGAGAGCALAVPLLNILTGPGSVVAIGMVAAAAAFLFAAAASRARRRQAVAAFIGLAALLLAQETTGILRIDFAKDELEDTVLYEKWNALARITVTERGTVNWGTSETYTGPKPETLWLKIDAEAGTPIVRFDGDYEKVRSLRYDITGIAYTLRRDVPVLVIGPGGGRDVLTALSFGYGDITGIEINPAIIDAVRGPFGDYTGHLYDRPEVRVVAAEARGAIRRSGERYGIIQSSLIDTWAATSAGAYVLSESGLYTKEAFVDFLSHLTGDGILSVSRWYFEGMPIETLRLSAVAAAALRDLGAADPGAHILVIKRSVWDWAYRVREFRDGIATLLVKRTPWLPEEVEHVRRLAEELRFDLVYGPGHEGRPEFAALMGEEAAAFERDYPVDLRPPTDDRPFFFYMLRPGDALGALIGRGSLEQGVMQNNVRAVFVLVALLFVVVLLVGAFLLLPVLLRRGERFPSDRRSVLFVAYFAALGLGFLTVEIPLVQRFILYLGHPVHALSVVLLSLLVGSGIGSLVAQRPSVRLLWIPLAATVAGVIVLALFLPRLFGASLAAPFPARVLLSFALLFPLGFLMGMPFPAGIRALGKERAGMVPWVWGVNGATSVAASVLATLLAISFGFRAVLLIGGAVYAAGLAAFLMLLGSVREGRGSSSPSPPR
ncbi:MAG: hypothetical protein ABIH26_03965 [Candidatus Eisenbacteria bacterium]